MSACLGPCGPVYTFQSVSVKYSHTDFGYGLAKMSISVHFFFSLSLIIKYKTFILTAITKISAYKMKNSNHHHPPLQGKHLQRLCLPNNFTRPKMQISHRYFIRLLISSDTERFEKTATALHLWLHRLHVIEQSRFIGLILNYTMGRYWPTRAVKHLSRLLLRHWVSVRC